MKPKQRVVVIGTGMHANVVMYNLMCQGKYEIAGFVTTDDIISNQYKGYPVVNGFKNFKIEHLRNLEDHYQTNSFFIGFGAMKIRKHVYNFFIENGWNSPNIIHPNAIVSLDTELGNGVLIEAGCLITPNPKIGDNVVINTGSQVNHDNIISDHVYIASGVVTSGRIEIGENTLIDDGVIISIGKVIGKNCIIGAGSVVTKNIPDNVIAYGNPCRVIRNNDSN